MNERPSVPEAAPTRVLSFFIPGTPAPGGSKRGFPVKLKSGRIRSNVVEDCARNPAWRERCAAAALENFRGLDGLPFRGAVSLSVQFLMPRPKNHFGARGGLKASAPRHHLQKPDRTKLLRALEDALSGVLWMDDVQVVGGRIGKAWVSPGVAPGAHVEIIAECPEAGAS